MKRAMTRYRLVCRICGRTIHYDPRRYAYVHADRGADHAPVPGMSA